MHFMIEPITTPERTWVRYTIETRESTFTVRAFSAGLLSAFAHNPTISIPSFEGEIRVGAAVEESTVTLVIHAASLAATDDIPAKDRKEIDRKMHEEALDTDSYPEIVYECSRLTASKTGEGQYWAALNGELTLHGVKRVQPVSARVSVNDQGLRAVGEFTVRQSDYEIPPVSAVGGTIRLKDELKLSFNISARKQP